MIPLFLRSANDRHPNGLANGSGMVGRNYMAHQNSGMVCLSSRLNPTVFQKTMGLNDYYFGADDSELPLGHISMLGKLDGNALKAGARFGVSPGATRFLLDAADDIELPYLPGAATATEAMALLERGYRFQKFFPAAAAGGPALLKSLAGPLPQIGFCPTGGITPATAREWLALPNVLCVGGSWLTPKALLDAGDWAKLEGLAREAAALR